MGMTSGSGKTWSDRIVTAHPNHVTVYGNDHSPWVQAVLLGLHDKGIAYTLVTRPPLSVFLDSGVTMPAARIDDGEWILDSERILTELGYSSVSPDDRDALQSTFGRAALRRADSAWTFWHRFSFSRDGHPQTAPRLWNNFWRAFQVFYFFVLITMVRRRMPRADADAIAEAFAFFEDRLAATPAFLGGDVPDTADLQLFGLIQMCASIPGPALAALRESPKLEGLRGWVGKMQARFSEYGRLYTAPVFEPKLTEIETASPLERAIYWAGAAIMWISLPITVPIVFYYAAHVRKKALVPVRAPQ